MGLFPNTVTLYHFLGEVDRRATYQRVVLEGVRLDEAFGETKDGPSLFVPKPEGYVPPYEFDGVNGWTLEAGDLVVPGNCPLQIPASATVAELEQFAIVYRVAGFVPLALGRRVSLDVSLA